MHSPVRLISSALCCGFAAICIGTAEGPTVVRNPRLIAAVAPSFPAKARRAGIHEATVLVQAVIDTEGRVSDPVVLRCTRPGFGFERAALKVIREWRYEPGLQDGRPVTVYFTIPIDFVLDPAGGPPDRNH